MDSREVKSSDPYFQLVLRYAEPGKGYDEPCFFVNIIAKFKHVELSKDTNDNNDTFYKTEESIIFSQTLPLPIQLLMKDDDAEARAAIDALLEDLRLPSSLFFLTDHIIESGRTMWRDYHLRYKILGLKMDVDVFVDKLPVDESSDDDDDEDEDDQMTAFDIDFMAANKMVIEGLKKVRIDGNDQVV